MSSAQIHTESEPYPHKWLILAAVGISLFMGTIDGTIVNVALPTLTEVLNTDFTTIQWVVLSFLLGLTVLMLSMGRLGDMIGKKSVFTSGLVIFVLGSILCGLAPNVYWLIGFRFIQAAGAAMMLALGVAIVAETWPTSERGKAIGISGGIISLGIAAGPALGGIILQSLSWHWIFFVNLPIGVVALVMVLLYVPPLKPTKQAESFDFAGALLIGGALLAFALAMSVAQDLGFVSLPVFGLLVAFLLGLVGFVLVESRIPHPMVDLALLRNSEFSSNLVNGFLTFIAIAGVVLLLPFYLQLVLGLEQQQVGLLMGVVPLMLVVIGPISGSLSDRVGTRRVGLVGLVILAFGYLVLSGLQVDSTAQRFVLLLLPVGVGMAIFQSPNNTAIMSAAPRHRLGIASGMLSMTRTLGQVTGIALLGAFFANRLQAYAGAAVDVNDAPTAAFVQALQDQFLLAAILVIIALGVAVWRWRIERRATPSPATPSAAR